MIKLHNLIYDNKEIQSKVNFFLDYFLFVNNRIGKDDLFTIETPLSIFENILIQLQENNLKQVPKYFDKYISNSLITNYTFSTGKQDVNEFNSIVNSYPINSSDSNTKTAWLKRNETDLINLIKDIIEAQKEELFKEYVKGIASFLFCNHKLNEHLESIKSITQLVVSDFLLNGFVKEDLEEYFKKEVITALHTPSKEDFAGLVKKLRFKSPETAHFLFKLEGISLKKDESEVEVGDVLIYSCLSEKFKNFYVNEQKQLFSFSEPVDANKFAIIGTEQAYRGINYGKAQSILRINDAIRKINGFTRYNCTLDSRNSIRTNDFKGYFIKSNPQHVEKYDKEEFNSLKDGFDGNLQAVKKIRAFDYLYEYALINKDIEKYWHYLEALYKSCCITWGTKEIVEYTSRILLYEHQNYQRLWLRSYIYRCVIIDKRVNLKSSLGYTHDEIDTMSNQGYDNFDIEDMKNRITNPFILDLIKIIESQKSEDDYKEMYTYYKNTLWELYEYRNHYVHAGKKIENIRVKMEKMMPMLISKFREALHEEAKKHPKKDLEIMIQSLAGKAGTKFKIP